MNKEIVEILNQLKKPPNENEVDHLLLLDKLYWKYSEGLNILQPVINYYLNGMDDLPTLKDKSNWNTKKFEEIRKPFTDSHNELIIAINEVLKNEILNEK